MTDPERCSTMTEVRTGVDALDLELSRLLAIRFRFMAAAARIKQNRGDVRDEARKAEVIARARANATASGWPEDIAARLWNVLIEESIAYELDRFDALG